MTSTAILPKNIIAYYRVSTKQQGDSGLGLEAQEKAINDFQRSRGGRVLASYTEVETGKNSKRPELGKAIAHARRSNALLVVAKLDRLARNVAFTAALMDSGLDFVCCDNPHASRLTIHILAAVAEHEARMISQRTKDALAAYKAGNRVSKRIRDLYPDGVPAEIVEATAGKLGAALTQCRNLSDEARVKGQHAAKEANHAKADAAYADLLPTLLEWKVAGLTQQAIADRLNEQGHTTRRGNGWSQVQVMRVLQRAS